MRRDPSGARSETGKAFDRARASLAFTLIEMLVVMAILGLLMATAFAGIGVARTQARIAKANVETRELLKAWLMYEAAYDDWPVSVKGDSLDATEGNLAELLGDNDQKMVYLNVEMNNGAFRDPWGTPYRFRILEGSSSDNNAKESFGAAITFPNRNREVQW